jgi:hypothetical protein
MIVFWIESGSKQSKMVPRKGKNEEIFSGVLVTFFRSWSSFLRFFLSYEEN